MADEGRWVTINGTHILLKGGESVSEGIDRKFGGGGKGKSSNGSSGGASKGGKKQKSPAQSTNRPPLSEDDIFVKESSTFNAEKAEYRMKSIGVKDITDTYNSASQEEKDKIIWTTEGYFGTMQAMDTNSYLRGTFEGTPDDWSPKDKEHLKNVVSHVDYTIDRYGSPMPSGTALYRGLSPNSGERMLKMNVGDVCEDKGYQSYSLDANHAYGFTNVKITSDKGQTIGGHKIGSKEDIERPRVMIRAISKGKNNALYNKANQLQTEREVLYKHGTKWRVAGKETVKSSKTGYSVVVITVEEE